MLIKNESLKEHGAGPYYAILIAKRVRFSIGGYGWLRKWYKPHFKKYRFIATHLGIGPFCITFIHKRAMYY